MEFRILGPLEVVDDDGHPVELGTGRRRALLADLLVHRGEVVSADRLIHDLWGEAPPATAAKALQGHVSQLRRALAPGATGSHESPIVTRVRGYALQAPPEALDATRFEQLLAEGRRRLAAEEAHDAVDVLRRALDLWRGPALAEFAFDDFAAAEHARLEELRLAALEERIEAELALGRAAELVGELEGLCASHPLRERLRGQLMLALYRSGRQADALDEYRRARRALVEELGLEPGTALQHLERGILAQDPSLDAVRSQSTGRDATHRPPSTAAPAAAGGDGIAVRPNSLLLVDGERNEITACVPVGRRPAAVAVGHGSIWVANADDGTVSRVDPRHVEVVRTIGIGAPAISLAIGDDAVWVANGSDGSVSRIDPDAEAVTDTVVLRGSDDLVWNTAYAVVATAEAVWVAVGPHELVSLDPATAEPVGVVGVGHIPIGLAVVDGAIWVVTMAQRALRIEPRTRTITAEAAVGSWPVAIAASERDVWVVNARGAAWCLDAGTGSVRLAQRIASLPTGVAVDDESVWVTDAAGGIARIEPERGELGAVLPVPYPATGVALGDGCAWVAVADEPY